MGYYGEADIEPMLAEFGEDLIFGSTTVKAVRDEADEEILNSMVAPIVGQVIVFTARTTAIAGLAVGDTISVGGDSYIFREPQRIGDGALTRLLCTRS